MFKEMHDAERKILEFEPAAMDFHFFTSVGTCRGSSNGYVTLGKLYYTDMKPVENN